jgi:glycosyltransferase involved in cell wall biosynthesis
MACEVPVIGSDSGEIPTVIGDAGLVFKEKDPDDLAAKVESLGSAAVRAEWARKGRARVLQNYSWEAVARQTLAFYRNLSDLKHG